MGNVDHNCIFVLVEKSQSIEKKEKQINLYFGNLYAHLSLISKNIGTV
jgi:hypothetical protein